MLRFRDDDDIMNCTFYPYRFYFVCYNFSNCRQPSASALLLTEPVSNVPKISKKKLIGAIIQSSLTKEQSATHAALLSQLTSKTSSIIQTLDLSSSGGVGVSGGDEHEHKLGGDDELTFLRIRSKKKEILIAPENEFLMVVIQNPNAGVGL